MDTRIFDHFIYRPPTNLSRLPDLELDLTCQFNIGNESLSQYYVIHDENTT